MDLHMMYVYVTCLTTGRHELFGPASPSECKAWLRIKKMTPGDYWIDARWTLERHLLDHHEAEVFIQVMN